MDSITLPDLRIRPGPGQAHGDSHAHPQNVLEQMGILDGKGSSDIERGERSDAPKTRMSYVASYEIQRILRSVDLSFLAVQTASLHIALLYDLAQPKKQSSYLLGKRPIRNALLPLPILAWHMARSNLELITGPVRVTA